MLSQWTKSEGSLSGLLLFEHASRAFFIVFVDVFWTPANFYLGATAAARAAHGAAG
jgi:hypothetical protein